MHIAIDDTYGPETATKSRYVTGNRRTNVAVVFDDDSVSYIRGQVSSCLNFIKQDFDIDVDEFHFKEIYNRRGPWEKLPPNANLGLFAAFAEIYSHHKWPVVIQTIDERTLADHGLKPPPLTIEELDLSKPEDLSLTFLCIEIKRRYMVSKQPLTLYVDQGRKKPGATFGTRLFGDWGAAYKGLYASSSDEPLLQIADFIAFVINRSTHLALKEKRTDLDNWFLELSAAMEINCDDLVQTRLPKDFTVADFDELHQIDRRNKRLE
ncbi:hypothetical protein [Rhizobium mulingense]|uniref:hypothetical protein n=1 Tax=Rhizobium mulingense TaxID=3031128 RepID=UPI002B47D281|nr:hypothetical protein [Rhizobium sp. MJ21]MEB3047688.1 hypothetical protein [Rhizobium sp. MJ21]